MKHQIWCHFGNNLDLLAQLPDNSVDSIVTDPPYGLGKPPDLHRVLADWVKHGHHDIKGKGFMGKEWDAFVPQPAFWKECLRVLKPGGHLLAFAGTRTQHLMATSIQLAGFEIRDMTGYIYGSGFPKSQNISKAIDKKAGTIGLPTNEIKQKLKKLFASSGKTLYKINTECGFKASSYLERNHGSNNSWGQTLPPYKKWKVIKRVIGYSKNDLDKVFREAERQVIGHRKVSKGVAFTSVGKSVLPVTKSCTNQAKQWDGWGTALKPALEPITIARKPIEGTVVQNVLKHGTGAINIDGCRINGRERTEYGLKQSKRTQQTTYGKPTESADFDSNKGRWPANLVHDGSKEVMDIFPIAGNNWKKDYGKKYQEENRQYGGGTFGGGGYKSGATYADSGSAARFFYCAKANRKDRDEGLEVLSKVGGEADGRHTMSGKTLKNSTAKSRVSKSLPRANTHISVKPTQLMRYLCRLVTPPNGIVLDPFMGSGSTGKAAILEGYRFIGAEQDYTMKPIVLGRLAHACKQHTMFGPDYSQAREDLLDALNSCNNL